MLAEATSRSSSANGAQPAAAHGLKLDLKLLDGNAVELSGDVVVTTDGMAVTPSGMGFTPVGSSGNKDPAAACGDDDWFAAYSGARSARSDGEPRAGSAAGSSTLEQVAGLSPLLTPSNNKLCAALVDAF